MRLRRDPVGSRNRRFGSALDGLDQRFGEGVPIEMSRQSSPFAQRRLGAGQVSFDIWVLTEMGERER